MFVFLSCFFPFDAVSCSKSYPAFVSFDVRSGNLVSSSYPLVRCFHVQFISRLCIIYVGSEKFVAKSCAFVFISYYSPVFSRMFSSTVRIPQDIPRVFNSCVVREFILNSCRALFAYSFQTRFQS